MSLKTLAHTCADRPRRIAYLIFEEDTFWKQAFIAHVEQEG